MLGSGGSAVETLELALDESLRAALDDHKQLRAVAADLAPTLGTTEAATVTAKAECDFGCLAGVELRVLTGLERLKSGCRSQTIAVLGGPEANGLVDLLLKRGQPVMEPSSPAIEAPAMAEPEEAAAAKEALQSQALLGTEGMVQLVRRLELRHNHRTERQLIQMATDQLVQPPDDRFDPDTGKLRCQRACAEAELRWQEYRSGQLPEAEAYRPFVLPAEPGDGSWRAPVQIRHGERYHILVEYSSADEVQATLAHWRRYGATGLQLQLMQRMDACAQHGPGSPELRRVMAAGGAVKKPRLHRSSSQPDWWYQDASGQVQGPFPRRQMESWLDAGYFQMSTLVHCGAVRPSSGQMRTVGQRSGGVLARAFHATPGRVIPGLLSAIRAATPPRKRLLPAGSPLPGMEVYTGTQPPRKQAVKRKRSPPPSPRKPANPKEEVKDVEMHETVAGLLGSERVHCGLLSSQPDDLAWIREELGRLLHEGPEADSWPALFVKRCTLFVPASVLECGGQIVVGPTQPHSLTTAGRVMAATAEAGLVVLEGEPPSWHDKLLELMHPEAVLVDRVGKPLLELVNDQLKSDNLADLPGMMAAEQVAEDDIHNISVSDLAEMGATPAQAKKAHQSIGRAIAQHSRLVVSPCGLWPYVARFCSQSTWEPEPAGLRLMARLSQTLYSGSDGRVEELASLLSQPVVPSVLQPRSKPPPRRGARGSSPSRESGKSKPQYPEALVQRCKAEGTNRARRTIVCNQMQELLKDLSGGQLDQFKKRLNQMNWPKEFHSLVEQQPAGSCLQTHAAELAAVVLPACKSVLDKVVAQLGQLEQSIINQTVAALTQLLEQVISAEPRTQRRSSVVVAPAMLSSEMEHVRELLVRYLDEQARPMLEHAISQLDTFAHGADLCRAGLLEACRAGEGDKIVEHAEESFVQLAEEVRAPAGGGCERQGQVCVQAQLWLVGPESLVEQLYIIFNRSIVAAAADSKAQQNSSAARCFSSTSNALSQLGQTVTTCALPLHAGLATGSPGALERQLLRIALARLGEWRRPAARPGSIEPLGGLAELCKRVESSPGGEVRLPKSTWQLRPASSCVYGLMLTTMFSCLDQELDLAVEQLQQLLGHWLQLRALDPPFAQSTDESVQRLVLLAVSADMCGCAIDVYTSSPSDECAVYRLEPMVPHPGGLRRAFRVAVDASGELYSISQRCAVMSPAQPKVNRFTLTQEEKDLKRRSDEEIAIEEQNVAEAQAEVEKRKLQRLNARID